MPKRKANWWPPSILADPDVLSVDDAGRFVLCKICHVHYAVHGGKKPKPVVMNSNFRTRAWDVHKERTNSHRLQKAQEKSQQLQQQQAQTQALPAQTPTLPLIASQSQPLTQQTHTQTQSQAPSQGQRDVRSEAQLQTPSRVHDDGQVRSYQHQQEQRRREIDEAAHGQQQRQIATHGNDIEPSRSNQLNAVTVVTGPGDAAGSDGIDSMTSNGKRPVSSPPNGTPLQRRRVFRAGSPGSSRQIIAESEAVRRMSLHPYDRHTVTPEAGAHERIVAASPEHIVALEQADNSRWRHLHHDGGRALNGVPRRRQQALSTTSYTSGELRAAKTLVQTETGAFGSTKLAKKLRPFNAEYHASSTRNADAFTARNTEVFDRRSAGYKEYWGTLRDVYTPSGNAGNTASYRKSHLRNILDTKAVVDLEGKETEADSTTPDDSASSEETSKPAVAVHDASLLSAIERLTDATSRTISHAYDQEASSTRDVLMGLTAVMTDIRMQQGNAFDRIIELQEKHLKVMEGILEVKLRKEAARNSNKSCSDGTARKNSVAASQEERNELSGSEERESSTRSRAEANK